MKKFFTMFMCVVMLWLVMTGCTVSKEDKQTTAEGYERLKGSWEIGALYYNNRIIDIHDNEAIEDLYDTSYFTFNEDGTYSYIDTFSHKGIYKVNPSDSEKNSFILEATHKVKYSANGATEEPYDSGAKKGIVTFLDENTFRYGDYDAATGKEIADTLYKIYKRSAEDSNYIGDNKTELNSNITTTKQNTTKEETYNNTQDYVSDLNSYDSIYNEYVKRMENAVPGLIREYKSESAGISDIQRLAEISNSKVQELAEISSEGITKMAEIMYDNGDSYSIYEEWSSKLQEEYMDLASEIQNAYIDSAAY